MIGILLNQGWVGPRDEYALFHIWDSLGSRLASAGSKGIVLWNQSIERGANLNDLAGLLTLKDQWRAAIANRAKGYLDDNKKTAQNEKKKLGLDDLQAPATADQDKVLNESRGAAKEIVRAREYGSSFWNMPVRIDCGKKDESGNDQKCVGRLVSDTDNPEPRIEWDLFASPNADMPTDQEMLAERKKTLPPSQLTSGARGLPTVTTYGTFRTFGKPVA